MYEILVVRMKKIGRNDPCPCGSGNKYKKCCIDKVDLIGNNLWDKIDEFTQIQKNQKSTEFHTKYNSKELLKIFSLLQLQIQNHGKNVRLEFAIIDIVNNINNIPTTGIDYKVLLTDIQNECQWHHFEDPPEEFFTENVLFVNGNNIVYPGISENGVEIVQGLLDAITSSENLPKEFMVEAMSGIRFLLHIHDVIAHKLDHTYRLYEEQKGNSLFTPNIQKVIKEKEYFAFSFEDIKDISDKLQIPYNTIDQFVFLWQKEKANFSSKDNNPLFEKPFVFIENEFILVLPTLQLHCLNEFIIKIANKYNCLERLLQSFAKNTEEELTLNCGKMNWKPVNFDFPQSDFPAKFIFREFLTSFDTDKFAYVTTVVQNPQYPQNEQKDVKTFSDELTKRVELSCSKIREKYDSHKILHLLCFYKTRISDSYFITCESKDTLVDYFLGMTPLVLSVLVSNWKFDRLTLWKYAKYYTNAKVGISFMPFNTHLSKFDWYQKNEESFHHPDKLCDGLFFDFDIEGRVKRDGISKLDRIGIPFISNGQFGYLYCLRREEHYPVYISYDVIYGIMKSCLLKYSCPIWIQTNRKGDHHADVYVTAILYWLNELYDDAKNYINQLGDLPLVFTLNLDDKFYDLKELGGIDSKKVESLFKYKIDPVNRNIDFVIPVQLINDLLTSNNQGEQVLMSFIIDMIGKLLQALKIGEQISIIQRDELINKNIPLGNMKMIIIATDNADIKISNVDIPDMRKIPLADISYVLENQLSQLGYKKKEGEITQKKEKIKLLNNLVALHFRVITEKIVEYNAISLLVFLMKKHEAILQKASMRTIEYPIRRLCYSKFYDVSNEFAQTEKDIVEISLALRLLIEFVACMDSKGKKHINDDDIDLLLAHMTELLNYGMISDMINFEIDNPSMRFLQSGRLSISNSDVLKEFRNNMYDEELNSYSDKFNSHFVQREREKPKSTNSYIDKVDRVFSEEWGISFTDIGLIGYIISYSFLFFKEKSVQIIKEQELSALIKENSDIADDTISAFLKQLEFKKRRNILTPPNNYENWEVYPWRYNRRLSYIMTPIIRKEIKGESHLIISARHLLMACDNLQAIFMNGTLKTSNLKILSLLSERNKIKGTKYRDDVYKWLINNTNLEVFKNEIKISRKGFFIAKEDKGDIDILGIDKSNRIIYSIECKNTSQSKVAHDFKCELDNYLGTQNKIGLIQKHINRHNWLNDNKERVCTSLGVDNTYEITSMVISKHILPLKFIKKTDIPVISFHDLKSRNFVF